MIKERIIWLIPVLAIGFLLINMLVPSKSEELQKDLFWINKTHSSKSSDIIILGDSRAYRGIDPKSFKKHFPDADVLNFGYSSAGFSSVYLDEAEKRFKSNSKQKIAILCITPFSLTDQAAVDQHFKEQLTLKKEEVFEKLFFGKMLSYFPSTSPEKLKNLSRDDKPLVENYIQSYQNNGWVASDYIQRDTSVALQSYRTVFEDNQVSFENLNRISKKISDWTNQGIKVFVLRPPSMVSMEQLENELSGFDEQIIRNQVETSGAIWIDFDSRDFESYDGSHLTEKSAIQLGDSLSYIINSYF